MAVGDPVFYEPLAVAFDKSGPDPSDMVTRVNQIVADMHEDGTLKRAVREVVRADLTSGTRRLIAHD